MVAITNSVSSADRTLRITNLVKGDHLQLKRYAQIYMHKFNYNTSGEFVKGHAIILILFLQQSSQSVANIGPSGGYLGEFYRFSAKFPLGNANPLPHVDFWRSAAPPLTTHPKHATINISDQATGSMSRGKRTARECAPQAGSAQRGGPGVPALDERRFARVTARTSGFTSRVEPRMHGIRPGAGAGVFLLSTIS